VKPISLKWYPVDHDTVALLAGERNIEVLAHRAKQEEAGVAARQAKRALWPTVRPGLRFFRMEGLTQATEGNFVQVGKQHLAVGAGLTLSLDVIRARTRVLAARQRHRAADQATEAARRAAILEAEDAYENLVAAQNELAIAKEVLEGALGLAEYQRARERSEAGLRSDRLRAEAEAQHARGEVMAAQAGFRDASAHLATVLRIDPRTTLYCPNPAIESLHLVSTDQPLDGMIAEALRQRPEILEATLLVEAAEEVARGARLGPWIPKVVAGVNGGAFGRNASTLDDQEVFTFGLEWNFSFERFGRRDEARAKADEARIEVARRREAIIAAVVKNHERVRVAGPAVEIARRRVEATKEALRLVTEQQKTGTSLLFEVLQAQRDLALARRALLGAILAQNRAQRHLYFATGHSP